MASIVILKSTDKMKLFRYFSFAVLILWTCFTHVACSSGSDDPTVDPEPTVKVSLSTPVVSEITTESAVITTNITGNSADLKKGFCYSAINKNPMTSDLVLDVNSTGGELQVTLSDLEPGTVYYVRAYASTSYSTTYSSVTSFEVVTNEVTEE